MYIYMRHTLSQTGSDTRKTHETHKRVCSIECKASYSRHKTLGRWYLRVEGEASWPCCSGCCCLCRLSIPSLT